MKTAEEKIALIKGRIENEYQKHQSLDWAQIAASKIYSEWSEFYEAQLIENNAEIDRLKSVIKIHELCNSAEKLFQI